MNFDPNLRPTASQTLQFSFFQVNSSLPPPTNSAEVIPSTFTRRPLQKSEADIREEEAALQKALDKELDKGQTFDAPEVNILYETSDVSRMQSTYIADRVAGVPRVGNPNLIPAAERPKRPPTLDDSLLDELGAVLGMMDDEFGVPMSMGNSIPGGNGAGAVQSLSRSSSQIQQSGNVMLVSSDEDAGMPVEGSPNLSREPSLGGLDRGLDYSSSANQLMPSGSKSQLAPFITANATTSSSYSADIAMLNNTAMGALPNDSLGGAMESAGSRYTRQARYLPGGGSTFGATSGGSSSSNDYAASSPAAAGGYASSVPVSKLGNSFGASSYGAPSSSSVGGGLGGGSGGYGGNSATSGSGYGGAASASGGYGGAGGGGVGYGTSASGGYGTASADLKPGPSSRFSRLASFGMGMGGGGNATATPATGGYGAPSASSAPGGAVGFGRHKF